MKTQQLYTGAARKLGDDLASKVGRSMMIHGPPRLSMQEQFENKPIPSLPYQNPSESSTPAFAKMVASADAGSSFATRKLVNDIRMGAKDGKALTWGKDRRPFGAQPAGVMNPIAGTVPTAHVRTEPIHMMHRGGDRNHTRTPFHPGAPVGGFSKPTSLFQAERMANSAAFQRDAGFTPLASDPLHRRSIRMH